MFVGLVRDKTFRLNRNQNIFEVSYDNESCVVLSCQYVK